MTSAHLIYIPLVAIAGLMLGFIVGARAARNAYDLEMKRQQERAEARAQRAARKAAREQARREQAEAASAADAESSDGDEHSAEQGS